MSHPTTSGDTSSSADKQEISNQAIKALDVYDQHVQYTDYEEKLVLRKIDFRLLPLLAITYGIQFMDKITLGAAAAFGIQEDLGLKGTEFSWLSAAFYISYLVFEFPLVSIMQKFPIAKFLGVNAIIWGGVVMAHASAHNFASLMVCRLLLGVFEATVSPGYSILTGRFYTKKELPFRISIWLSFNGLGNFIGTATGYGIGKMHTTLPAWKYIFLILGAITSVWGVVIYFALASSPIDASFLTERERKIAVARVAKNKSGVSDERKIRKYQIWEALTDVQVLLIFLISTGIMLPNGGITNFLGLVVKGLGFTITETMERELPNGASQFVLMLVGGYMLSKANNNRLFISAAWLVPCIICSVLLWKLPRTNTVGLLISTYFLSAFVITMVALLSILNTNISGTTKKSTAHAIYFIGYCAGNIAGPFFFKSNQAPEYIDGSIMMIICFTLSAILLLILRFYYTYENRRKMKALEAQGIIDPTVFEKQARMLGFHDHTDKENPYFFYSL